MVSTEVVETDRGVRTVLLLIVVLVLMLVLVLLADCVFEVVDDEVVEEGLETDRGVSMLESFEVIDVVETEIEVTTVVVDEDVPVLVVDVAGAEELVRTDKTVTFVAGVVKLVDVARLAELTSVVNVEEPVETDKIVRPVADVLEAVVDTEGLLVVVVTGRVAETDRSVNAVGDVDEDGVVATERLLLPLDGVELIDLRELAETDRIVKSVPIVVEIVYGEVLMGVTDVEKEVVLETDSNVTADDTVEVTKTVGPAVLDVLEDIGVLEVVEDVVEVVRTDKGTIVDKSADEVNATDVVAVVEYALLVDVEELIVTAGLAEVV